MTEKRNRLLSAIISVFLCITSFNVPVNAEEEMPAETPAEEKLIEEVPEETTEAEPSDEPAVEQEELTVSEEAEEQETTEVIDEEEAQPEPEETEEDQSTEETAVEQAEFSESEEGYEIINLEDDLEEGTILSEEPIQEEEIDLFTSTAADFEYNEGYSEIWIDKYIGSDPNVVIPSEINGKIVARINQAFTNCTNVTSVSIPGTVQYIGTDAFSGCTNLNSVYIAEGVPSIGQAAFMDCTGLTEVTLPSTIVRSRLGRL